MGLTQLVNSKRARQLSAVSMLVEAGFAVRRGKAKLAAMLVGGAVLAYRFTALGFLAQILYRLYRRQRQTSGRAPRVAAR